MDGDPEYTFEPLERAKIHRIVDQHDWRAVVCVVLGWSGGLGGEI